MAMVLSGGPRPARVAVLVTCEHGGNRIPADLAPRFRGMGRTLRSHRGYDPGALIMARALAAALDAPLVASTVSRLVIDLNRSLHHPRVWSQATRALPRERRERIVQRHYAPYRRQVEDAVAARVREGRMVVHLSSHSFTPVLDGKRRLADVGLLYDPRRAGEAALCGAVKAALRERVPSLRVRRNYPYAGNADGLTTFLRKRYRAAEYAGVEIELNQAIVGAAPRRWTWLRDALVAAVEAALP